MTRDEDINKDVDVTYLTRNVFAEYKERYFMISDGIPVAKKSIPLTCALLDMPFHVCYT